MRCSLTSSSFRCSISRSRDSSCSSLVTSCWCCARISTRSSSAGSMFKSGSAFTAMRGVSHELARFHAARAQKSCGKNLAGYTDNCGSHVRSGRRQSMPSSNIDNCARVSETVPLVACGHTKRPRSSRFAQHAHQRLSVRRIHAPAKAQANSRSREPAATSSPACTPQVSLPGTADASQRPGSR